MNFFPTVALSLLLATFAAAAPQHDQYVLGPDSQVQKDVPQGKVMPMPAWTNSKIYSGTTRDWHREDSFQFNEEDRRLAFS